MRSSRLSKYRKKYRKLIIVAQIVAIWYAAMVSFSVLTSSTGAFFNETKEAQTVIQAGTWWDKSDLEFIGIPTQNVKACPNVAIAVELQNKGFAMTDSTRYEVFYEENGQPRINGEKIAEGVIGPMGAGEIIELTYDVVEEGSYIFKAYQVEGYEGSDPIIWSEKVMDKCLNENANDDAKQNEKPATEDTNTEEKPKQNNNEETNNDDADTTEDTNNESNDNKSEEKPVENESAEDEKPDQEIEEEKEDSEKSEESTDSSENPDQTKQSEPEDSSGLEEGEQ
ncbi:amyloid fiber anchoring/assembly protein TapA [Aquibacillus koreensis]|uniref:Amyloid fiber anchoring/assembly protein TapA n=1 Tax=Aquibacillus koreensis TaxID=279446 RepID=A0A9X3WH45_9BACI|nr:amyloid fiber anchoring/assembly protein TapA [Aquibacillus koreensis]MCT2534618.1 amyloid fiber anchoring/assembly protein TapA [Aquibacillus koreensis]MDC3419802.1 amyloid fiber anchoring/assembly protein TapA [Aquibacillus koreensis]